MKRVLLLLALSATFGIALVAVAPVGAVQAAGFTVPAPNAPPMINVLPSTVSSSTSALSGYTRLEAQMAILYKFAKTPQFWQAAADVQAGVGSPAQQQTVTQVTSTHAVPSTKMAKLSNAAGAVGSVLSTFQLSQWASNGIMQMVGFDANGLVCETGEAWISIVTGQDCSGFNQLPPDYVTNVDATATTTGVKVCNPAIPANCVTLTHAGMTYQNNGVTYDVYCFIRTGNQSQGFNVRYGSETAMTGSGAVSSSVSTWTARCGTPANTPGGALVQQPATRGPLLEYGYAGQTAPVQTTTANPERRMKCVVLGTDGNTYTAYSEPYFESDPVLPQPVCPDLPEGVYPDKTTIWDTGGPNERKLWEETTTPEFKRDATQYPECMKGVCPLQLEKNGVSCFVAVELCTDWFESPDKEQTMTCRYGTHVVPLSECNVYGPSFKPDAQTKGDTLGNPDTGQPTSNPNPGSGTDTKAGTRPVTDPDAPGERQCFPTGWGVLNPVEWVMKPTQCALEWAFVPRQSVLTAQLTKVATAWDDTIVLQIPRMIGGWAIETPAGGCGGLVADMGFLPGGQFPDISFFNACPGDPLAPFAGIIKPWLTVSFIVAVAMSMYASVSMVVGANK